MSLVDVIGMSEKVEFNDFEYLYFIDGWNGGKYNNYDVVINPQNYDFILFKNNKLYKVEAKTITVSGVDYDMGHEYSWMSERLAIKIDNEISTVWLNYLEIKGCKILFRKKNIA